MVHEPGWRWSSGYVREVVGGEWSQARHVGVVLSGGLGFLMESGSEYTVRPYDAYDIPPGHHGYVIGDEPAVVLEWAGLRTIAGRQRTGATNRIVATLLFTDLANSTVIADTMGDVAWRERLAGHIQACRDAVERFGGIVVTTTGDGLLATFNAPTVALSCPAEIQRRSTADGLQVRAGIHVGEVLDTCEPRRRQRRAAWQVAATRRLSLRARDGWRVRWARSIVLLPLGSSGSRPKASPVVLP